jgi:uncharacterized membrane protein YfcA
MRIVLVLGLAVVGAFVGVLITLHQPGHQPWPLVGLVAGGLLGLCWLPPSSRAGADSGRRRPHRRPARPTALQALPLARRLTSLTVVDLLAGQHVHGRGP